MNILKYTDFLLNKPSVFQIKKTETLQQFAVALGRGTILEKHTTEIPATLIVLKGEIKFVLPDEELTLKEFDIFEIPVDVEHSVHGILDKNLFLITKEIEL
ncbi:MAG: hypothetical protein K0M63_03625 [Weeksellaceae bacterium]|nr:hypothetical protein [Weeksellaceae bacterium]